MIVLALDTSSRLQSVALADPGGIPAQERFESAARHSETILPAVDRVLSRAGVSPSRLGAVAVTSGPGSFTGLRVGLATAKGLALAAGVPLAGFSTLRILAEALAAEARSVGLGDPGQGICALMEAGRGQLYRGTYRVAAASAAPWTLAPEDGERLVAPGEALEGLQAPVAVGGGGLQALRAGAPSGFFFLQEPVALAPTLAPLALELLRTGRFPAGPLEPSYIRPPDALRGGKAGRA